MKLTNWINNNLPSIVNQLEKDILSGFHIQTEEGLNLSGRNAIYELLDAMLSVLFPGAFSKEKVSRDELNFYLGDTLRHISYKLRKQVEEVLEFHCVSKKVDEECEECDCEEKSDDICKKVIESLPDLRKILLEDINAALEGVHSGSP